MIHGKLVSFTDRGSEVAARIAALLADEHIERYARTVDTSLGGTALTRFAQQAMVDCDLLVFIGATGIAVRAIAPYLAGKTFDPAVLVVDEGGKFVISLLSGHLGGANELAVRLADGLGVTAVITTATDGRSVFAVDNWAKEHDCAVVDPQNIKHVSGALLRNETVGLKADWEIDGVIPPHISAQIQAESGFAISYDTACVPFANTLHLVPRIVHLGIGCRKGTAAKAVERAVEAALLQAGIPIEAIRQAASIDLKKNELGLCLFCEQHQLPFVTYTAEELGAVPGDFTSSGFVAQTVGVDNVCERAAVRSSDGGKIRLRKMALDGVTVALAEEYWRVSF